jgi:hypothetical protein
MLIIDDESVVPVDVAPENEIAEDDVCPLLRKPFGSNVAAVVDPNMKLTEPAVDEVLGTTLKAEVVVAPRRFIVFA